MKASLLIAALSSVLLRAQPVSSPATPKFDVVSIKTCKPGVTKPGGSSPGRLHISCGVLANTDNTGLIQVGYNRYASGRLTSYAVIPIEGGPDWIHSETYEIDAKSDGQPSFQMMEGPMMQAILEDRFKLRIHRETRQGPVYELVLGKGSPKLKQFPDGSCIPVVLGRSLPPLSPGQHYCNYFEIHLVFSPNDSEATRPVAANPGVSAEVRAPEAPGIFQAIQEQLGLKLVPSKGPVDVLVIDHIERPSEN